MNGMKLLSASEFEERSGLPKLTIYRLVRERHLPHVRLGRRVYFPVSAVAQFLTDQANRSIQG